MHDVLDISIRWSVCAINHSSQSFNNAKLWQTCYDCDNWFCGGCVATIILISANETDEFCCADCRS